MGNRESESWTTRKKRRTTLCRGNGYTLGRRSLCLEKEKRRWILNLRWNHKHYWKSYTPRQFADGRWYPERTSFCWYHEVPPSRGTFSRVGLDRYAFEPSGGEVGKMTWRVLRASAFCKSLSGLLPPMIFCLSVYFSSVKRFYLPRAEDAEIGSRNPSPVFSSSTSSLYDELTWGPFRMLTVWNLKL